MPFSWKDALELVSALTQAIIGACQAGKSRAEVMATLRDAVDVELRRAQIEQDVADAIAGKKT